MALLERPHPTLSPEALLRQAGRTGPTERFRPLAEAMVALARTLAVPRMVWTEAAVLPPGVSSEGPALRAEGRRSVRLPREALPLLAPATRVLAAVGTLGPLLPERTEDLGTRGLVLESFLLDACGTLILEELAGDLGLLAARRAREIPGGGCSPLLYPGSAPGLPLSLQADLVHLSGASDLGVRVTSRHLLVPRMSVSLLVGLGSYPHREPPSSCSVCSRTSCPYRTGDGEAP